jgi:hypothetical protein
MELADMNYLREIWSDFSLEPTCTLVEVHIDDSSSHYC